MKTHCSSHSLLAIRPSQALLLCCLLALLFAGYSGYAGAAEKKSTAVNKVVKEVVLQSVNINRASAETIAATLKGVGLQKAKALVAWRQQNGKFTHLEQLLEVKGIGKKTLELNKGRIKL